MWHEIIKLLIISHEDEGGSSDFWRQTFIDIHINDLKCYKGTIKCCESNGKFFLFPTTLIQ